ncbi:MAG: hypothetical protein KGL48_00260 [Sphingomonadales bacterium]|nr:hypothetical protein [Sphingomonadales bacterium]MDE2569549.1 hypothetical protein [Sphingomonadales bacterium]
MMRTTHLFQAAAIAGSTVALAAMPARAQTTDPALQQMYLAGTAPIACVINPPRVTNAQNASFSANGAGNGQVTITQLVDGQTALALASSIELDFPVVCNASHSVVLTSANGGLQGGGASVTGSGFSNFLSYRVQVDWAGVQIAKSSDAGATTINSADPAQGDMVIRLSTPAGDGPLVAGQYSDSIVVQFTPAS